MSRRNPGEGTIVQRPNGLWQASIQVNGARKTVYGKTEREVRKKLAQIQRQVAVCNSIPAPGRRKVRDLLEEWLNTARPSLRPKTLDHYGNVIRLHINPAIGNVPLSKLTPTHIQHLYTGLQEKGVTRTAVQVHNLLHKALKVAVLWNWLPDNPTERTVKPTHQYKRKDVWSQEELSLFLGATEDRWLQPLWVVAISTGCRLGELLALRWEDVDLVARAVTIGRSLQRIAKEWVEGEPKTRAGERTISLPGEAVEALRRQKVIQAQLRLKAGPEWGGRDLVFTGEMGQPLQPTTVQHAIRRVCKGLGIKPMTPHGLRHLHASLLLAKGLPVTTVSQRLGHANPGVTMTVYAHALKHQDGEAARVMQAVLQTRR